ncbi:hypothetical protein [Methylophaga sp. OBS3]|uniref:hypothetical protein n=1 Tax=Methylophaga sp. OBS3 TaxID=2991934 RepID=UPI002257016A|nr:hypothetical protein [Methylophaga sp. OBS3]MCX4189240.1 hypothetical protein [Methylophaga sp. OBS3]
MSTVENNTTPQAKVQMFLVMAVVLSNLVTFGILYWFKISIFEHLAIAFAGFVLLSFVEVGYLNFIQKLRQRNANNLSDNA